MECSGLGQMKGEETAVYRLRSVCIQGVFHGMVYITGEKMLF